MPDNDFRAEEYLYLNPDVQAVLGGNWLAARQHWLTMLREMGGQGHLPGGFDAAGYLALNPDVAAAFAELDPVERMVTVYAHYWFYGSFEERTFDDFFHPRVYLEANPDVLAFFGWDLEAAFLHWVRYGFGEGRKGR